MTANTPAANPPPTRALILSDNEGQRASFVRLVGRIRNCKPTAFENVDEAVRWAIPNQPQLIVLVDMRPTHQGIAFLRVAQTVPELAAIPKMFISAADSEARTQALSLGAADISGTSNPAELVDRMQALMALSRLHGQSTIDAKEVREKLEFAESRSTRYLRRLETLYKAAVEGELSDAERITALLNAGANSLRPGGNFLGMFNRISGSEVETLSLADEHFEKHLVQKMPKVGDKVALSSTVAALIAGKDYVVLWNDLWVDQKAVSLGQVRELGLRSAIGVPFNIDREQFFVFFASRHTLEKEPFVDDDSAYIELVATIITMILKERKRTAQLRWQAERDDLTGLPNRTMFRRALVRAVENGQGRKFAVLQFDLDHFQVINDSLGHAAGDEVLKAIGQRLQQALKNGEMVSRLGGDEFAISLVIDGPNAVEQRAKELLALFESPITVAGMQLQIGTTIGGAVFPDHSEKVDELLPRADAALYEGKREERGTFRLFDPAIAARLEKRRSLQSEMQNAVANNEFVLYFQPEVDFRTGAIIGAESLIRWRHPKRGIVGPGEFIPYAEESTLIRRIGAWTLESACDTVSRFTREVPDFRLYVNLSGGQLSDPGLLDSMMAAIGARNVRSANLGFEITESMAMKDPRLTHETVAGLRKRGFKVAIDDFGTGYSSLAYLTSLDPDVIKIDKSFVDGLPTSSGSAAIIETVVLFAQKTKRLVLAEGVEELPQMHWLYKAGVNICQGYHVAKPMPVDECVTWMQRWKTTHPVGKPLPWHMPG